MKRYNEFLILLSIVFLNFFTVECVDFTLDGKKNDDGKLFYVVKGSFETDGENDYYVSLYVERPSHSGMDFYVLWYTFASPQALKEGISTNDGGAVLEYTWKYNNQDPEGANENENLFLRICRMKPTFKKDSFVKKYSEKNLKRHIRSGKELLNEFDDEISGLCSVEKFKYSP